MQAPSVPNYAPMQQAPSYVPAPAPQQQYNPTQYRQNFENNLPTQQVQRCSMTSNGNGGYIQRCW